MATKKKAKKPTKKIKVGTCAAYFNAWPLLCELVERGVSYGYNRAHKHTDTPERDAIEQAIVDAIMSEMSEYLVFPEQSTRGELW